MIDVKQLTQHVRERVERRQLVIMPDGTLTRPSRGPTEARVTFDRETALDLLSVLLFLQENGVERVAERE